MRKYLITMVVILSTACLVSRAKADDRVYVIEGETKFPKVEPGSLVRFHQCCHFNGGNISVKVEGPAKLVRQSSFVRCVDGEISRTGTNDTEFEIKAQKAGKAKVLVTVKDGKESKTTEYELVIE
jgi:hypothetical protein